MVIIEPKDKEDSERQWSRFQADTELLLMTE